MISAEVMEICRAHIGRTREASDAMAPESAKKLAKLMGWTFQDTLPLCWHWAYFNAAIAPEDVGHDGHERLGLFLPDVPLPRRMWAAGEIDVISPLEIGVPAHRVSTIEDVVFKTGRTGELCFVTVRHEIAQGTSKLRERQTIVYREAGQAEDALRKAHDPLPEGFEVVPDTTLLAYSAITQNGHRIHWDRDFCRDVEKYPDLVVHGPLLASMLGRALEDTPAACHFQFRAKAPVFATSPIRVERDGAGARVLRSDNVVAMEAMLTPK